MKGFTIKSIMILGLLATTLATQAQTIEDAIKLYKYDRFSSAKQILEPMAATNPLANYYVGLCEIGLENKANAKNTFQKFPDDAANMAGVARVLFLEGKTAEANATATKVALKAKKKDYLPMKYAAEAITYTNGGDPLTAVELYKKAMAIERTGDMHIGIGDAYRKIQGGGGNAMNNYEYAEMIPEFSSLANYKMGNHWYAAKNYDSALAKYARASKLDEKNPLPYRDLANAYYKIGKFELSADNNEKYLKLSDNSIDDQIMYANSLYQAQKYDKAIAKMQELISKGAEKPYMYRVIGYSQYELKDFNNAKINLDKLFAKQEPSKIIPMDYIYSGKIMMMDSTKTAEANVYFDKGVNADTSLDKNYIYRDLGEAFKNKDDYKSASKWYRKIAESNLPSIQSLDTWWAGVLSFFAGENQEADNMLNKMATKYPDYKSTYYYAARNMVAWKDKDSKNGAGVEPYKKWLAMVNDDPAEKDNLKKAYAYLGTLAFNMKNKEDMTLYSTKLITLDPNDVTAKFLLKALTTMK
jgi:predicted Zn-dependent protease